MKVPYADKWSKETEALRRIALAAGLTEEEKWSKPCFTWRGKNVAIVIPLKESCAFMFTRGALLKDPKRLLGKVGENSQSNRWIKFTSPKEVAALRLELGRYLREAIKVAESGKKVALKKVADYAMPAELQAALKANSKLRAAYAALTPGRQKSWILHIAGAKQAATREARVEKSVLKIQQGLGFNERAS